MINPNNLTKLRQLEDKIWEIEGQMKVSDTETRNLLQLRRDMLNKERDQIQQNVDQLTRLMRKQIRAGVGLKRKATAELEDAPPKKRSRLTDSATSDEETPKVKPTSSKISEKEMIQILGEEKYRAAQQRGREQAEKTIAEIQNRRRVRVRRKEENFL